MSLLFELLFSEAAISS